jgi:holo-[acyl-carrier protein] synthase
VPGARIGVDVVAVQRVRELIAGPGLGRMLLPAELGDGTDAVGIAGRLAAKEAVFKLFHAADAPVPWLSTEIRTEPGGWPTVRLHGRAATLAESAGITDISISITHDGAYAIAVAAGQPATSGGTA